MEIKKKFRAAQYSILVIEFLSSFVFVFVGHIDLAYQPGFCLVATSTSTRSEMNQIDRYI